VPIHEYRCLSCKLAYEELFLGSDVIPEHDDCPSCGKPSKKVNVNHFRHIGPVFEGLEHYSQNLLTRKQRASGQEFKSYKDIQRFEQENNLCRVTPGSSVHREQVESAYEEDFEKSKRLKESGLEGVADYIYQKEMQDATGWSDSKYTRWKNLHDKAQSDAKSGKIDISQAATAKPLSANS
jgi:putative FmdB family regulatory protein